MVDTNTLITEKSKGVFTLSLNRPKANAFDDQMVQELGQALKEARRDESIRCVVLTGSGRFFSAGQDLRVVSEIDGPVTFREHLKRTYNPIIRDMRRLEKPIVGAINGPAAGAGLGIALACDIRWASESARFVFGFTGIGLTADSGTSLTLPLLVGLGRAAEMAFTNQTLTAEQALDYGLVTNVLSDEALPGAVFELAASLASGPTIAVGLTKRAFNHAHLAALEASMEYEAHMQEIAGRTADHKEGVAAFLEKRPPVYKGA